MDIKAKALAVTILALVGTASLGVASASGERGGHFFAGAAPTTVTWQENENDRPEFVGIYGLAECTEMAFHGQMTETENELTITPLWNGCSTTGSETEFSVHENGCYFVLKVGTNPSDDNIVDITCPGEPMTLTQTNCLATIPSQTATGISYTTVLVNGKLAVTLDFTLKGITIHYEAGICVVAGTSHATELMTGSVIMTGEDAEGNPVDIYAANPQHAEETHEEETAETQQEEVAETHQEETLETFLELEAEATHQEETAATERRAGSGGQDGQAPRDLRSMLSGRGGGIAGLREAGCWLAIQACV